MATIAKLNSNSSSITFEWEQLPECVKLISGKCSNDDGLLLDADLNRETRTGVCQPLASNLNHTITLLTENKANRVTLAWTYTKVGAAVIRSSSFAGNSLRLFMNINLPERIDPMSIKLFYYEIIADGASASGFSVEYPKLGRLENGTYFVNFTKGEMEFATTYGLRVQTSGCEGTCSANSTESRSTTGK